MDFEYCTFDGDEIAEVRCKGACKTVLVVRGKPTADYATLVIAMRETTGTIGRHLTPLCVVCKARILVGDARPNELESIYVQDIKQMISEAVHYGVPYIEAIERAQRLAARTPVEAVSE